MKGLTTIYEESLGAIAKGGSTPLRAVYEYAEQSRTTFTFMDTPGYDPVSATSRTIGELPAMRAMIRTASIVGAFN